MTDWGVHLIDMALWGMNVKGMPKRVISSGGNFAYPDNYAETFDTLSVIYEYDDFKGLLFHPVPSVHQWRG